MLLNLHVKNLAIIDEVEVDFAEHFNVLTGETGAGKSIMPIEWHERIAEWLEKMIGKNLFVSKYVEGNPDPYYPGSSVRLSEIDKAIEYFDEKERIYPEDLQPYLAFVEWYIQKVCCERICADMQPKVLSFCKRIFLEI